MNNGAKILVYGYGNPGRQDDGLGAHCIKKLEDWLVLHPNYELLTDTNYQLNIEDAAAISEVQRVVFVDASIEDIDGFSFTPIQASDAKVEFSMHAVSPSFVVDLCQKIYGRSPEAFLLHIKGYEWDFKEGLTPRASQNLDAAFEFLLHFLNPNVEK